MRSRRASGRTIGCSASPAKDGATRARSRKRIGSAASSPLTVEQLALLLRAAQQHSAPREALLLLTLADTGLRPSEALALQWPDLDLAARTLLAPVEIPVGILTALVGGPFFLWLLVRRS